VVNISEAIDAAFLQRRARHLGRIDHAPTETLRRSPKPGAFTAQAFNVPRSLFTTRVASASPSTSSAMIGSGFPGT